MKKKSVIAIFVLLICISLVYAQTNATTIDPSLSKIDQAYECVKNQAKDRCMDLSFEERIFSLFATGVCQAEVMAASQGNGDCWPTSSGGTCSLKTTSQAIMALSKTNADTLKAQNWLISQNISPADVVWYLQIESSSETNCDISYRGENHRVTLRDDKTFNTNAGTCLTRAQDNYLFQITAGCLEEEFTIKCDKDFQTNLLFRRQASNIWHLSGRTTRTSADGTSKEQVKSSCFKGSGGTCDYEGSLWATYILKTKGYDITSYMPYLITFAEQNKRFFPEAFLYGITGEDSYKTDLLLKQSENKFWEQSGDRYSDTATVLLTISDEPTEKVNTKNWLLDIQQSDGCFPTNLRNNAFLLGSIWPRQLDITIPSCIGSGYYCVHETACESANIKTGYHCPGIGSICCSIKPPLQSCEEQEGEICAQGQVCVGGRTTNEVSDSLELGQTCCIAGECRVQTQLSECEQKGGRCEPGHRGCGSGYIVRNDYECDFVGDVCCLREEKKSSLWWIWVLLLLIILVVVGIIFKNKIKEFIDKKGFSIGGKPSHGPGPGHRPGPGNLPGVIHRPIPMKSLPTRRILPSQHQSKPVPQKPVDKKSDDLNDVLNKLKSFGK